MGVANEHNVDTDINLKSLKESTVEVILNYFNPLHSSTSFLCQVLLGVEKRFLIIQNFKYLIQIQQNIGSSS